MTEKISAVYQIKNKVTGERYVGSSVDVKRRWWKHKCPSTWKAKPNKRLYRDFQEYGLDNFMFAILAPVEPEYLRQVEQEFIDLLKPAYNNINANGWDVERHKASKKAYSQSEKGKASQKVYRNKLCNYNGETLTLHTLAMRFKKAGIQHATLEAKKYLIQLEQD